MTLTGDIIEKLKENWAIPRQAVHCGKTIPFSLCCEFDVPATAEQIDQIGVTIPESVRQFWLHARSAVLFKDVDYGQWGLRILTPSESLEATKEYLQSRRRDAITGDQVIGAFLGDSDIVVVRCDNSAKDFGSVLVALPMDSRPDWEDIGDNFGDFIQRYAKSHGEKYWEMQ